MDVPRKLTLALAGLMAVPAAMGLTASDQYRDVDWIKATASLYLAVLSVKALVALHREAAAFPGELVIWAPLAAQRRPSRGAVVECA